MAESAKDIKRRIVSVQNTRQITKAMEMVSAAKMRKSQEVALMARPFALKALELLKNLSGKIEDNKLPLLAKNDTNKVLLVIQATDKGLCGGLNSNLFKKILKYLDELEGKELEFITIGKKAREWSARMRFEVAADFEGFGDKVDIVEVLPLARMLIKDFEAGKYESIVFAYTDFKSTLKQDPLLRPLLPISREVLEKVVEEILPVKGKFAEKEKPETVISSNEYIFEPSPEEVLKNLLPKLIETQVYQLVLEANASEHSARMVAMKNASEAAGEMLDELDLSYNKARQASITQEIAEISAGRAALEE